MSRAALIAEGVAFPDRLQRTDLTLAPASLTAVIGPNGSGKTSLLRALARIDQPQGRVLIDGEDLDRVGPARRSAMLSFLPAAREIAWPIPVRDVIALGMVKPSPRRVGELLEQLELGALAERPADRLSTGERARVLLARALAPRPRVLLLDEPLSNLDPYWVLTTLAILREAARQGSAVLVSLHDLALLSGFDRALMTDKGRLAGDGSAPALLGSEAFRAAFRVVPEHGGWRPA